jgi:hypothetical protein
VTTSFGLSQSFANNYGPDALASLLFALTELVRGRAARCAHAWLHVYAQRSLGSNTRAPHTLTLRPARTPTQTGLPSSAFMMSATAFYVDLTLRLEGVTTLSAPQVAVLVQARVHTMRAALLLAVPCG